MSKPCAHLSYWEPRGHILRAYSNRLFLQIIKSSVRCQSSDELNLWPTGRSSDQWANIDALATIHSSPSTFGLWTDISHALQHIEVFQLHIKLRFLHLIDRQRKDCKRKRKRPSASSSYPRNHKFWFARFWNFKPLIKRSPSMHSSSFTNGLGLLSSLPMSAAEGFYNVSMPLPYEMLSTTGANFWNTYTTELPRSQQLEANPITYGNNVAANYPAMLQSCRPRPNLKWMSDADKSVAACCHALESGVVGLPWTCGRFSAIHIW